MEGKASPAVQKTTPFLFHNISATHFFPVFTWQAINAARKWRFEKLRKLCCNTIFPLFFLNQGSMYYALGLHFECIFFQKYEKTQEVSPSCIVLQPVVNFGGHKKCKAHILGCSTFYQAICSFQSKLCKTIPKHALT